MARKHEAEQHLLDGCSPLEISKKMRVTVSTVIQYLCTRIGEGAIGLIDIYFSWTAEQREFLHQTEKKGRMNAQALQSLNLSSEEVDFFHTMRKSHVFRGGMYELVSELELMIHEFVRKRLIEEYGNEEKGWWREGIPLNVRISCQEKREQDNDPCEDAYFYTTLIQLSVIITKRQNWKFFEPLIPSNYRQKKSNLISDLLRLNRIRNRVMHPVKNNEWHEDDFEFVRMLSEQFSGMNKNFE